MFAPSLREICNGLRTEFRSLTAKLRETQYIGTKLYTKDKYKKLFQEFLRKRGYEFDPMVYVTLLGKALTT